MAERNPITWTEEKLLALEKAKRRLRTNKRVGEKTGIDPSIIGKCLVKDGGWIAGSTYERLLNLPEFVELEKAEEQRLNSDWFKLSSDERLLIDLVREFPEHERCRIILDVVKQLRLRNHKLIKP